MATSSDDNKTDIIHRVSNIIRSVRALETHSTALETPTSTTPLNPVNPNNDNEKELDDLESTITETKTLLGLFKSTKVCTKDEILIFKEAITHVIHRIQVLKIREIPGIKPLINTQYKPDDLS
jgi:hypothetical protein